MGAINVHESVNNWSLEGGEREDAVVTCQWPASSGQEAGARWAESELHLCFHIYVSCKSSPICTPHQRVIEGTLPK